MPASRRLQAIMALARSCAVCLALVALVARPGLQAVDAAPAPPAPAPAPAPAPVPAPGAIGTWTSSDGKARLAVVAGADGTLRGSIVWMDSPNDEAGKPRRDTENPEEGLRGRKLLGLTILTGLSGNPAEGWHGGSIYDPESGSSYRCKASIGAGGEELHLRGYIGFSLLGRTEVWKRYHAPPPAAAAPAAPPAPAH